MGDVIDPALAVLVVVIALGLAFDFVNGFHDTANAIATSVATRVLSPGRAVSMAAILNVVGALTGTFLTHIDEQFAARGRRFGLPQLRRRPRKLNGFVLERGRLALPSDDFFVEDPVRLIESAADARPVCLLQGSDSGWVEGFLRPTIEAAGYRVARSIGAEVHPAVTLAMDEIDVPSGRVVRLPRDAAGRPRIDRDALARALTAGDA